MTKISDYKIVAHGSVFLLMAQNEAASLNLIENYENSNFNNNGGRYDKNIYTNIS